MSQQPKKQSIFDKLTDPKQYTGAHKHRFDEAGNGRGLAGRDRVAKGHGFIAGAPGAAVADLSQITRSNLHTSGAGYRPPSSTYQASPSSGTLLYQRTSIDGSAKAAPLTPPSPTGFAGPSTPSPRPSSVGRAGTRASYSGGTGTSTGLSYSGYTNYSGLSPAPATAAYTRASDSGQRKTSIFDRLNDPSSYTGMHKERFTADGRGRGAEGRTMRNSYVAPADLMRRP